MKLKNLFIAAFAIITLNGISQTLYVPSGTSGIGSSTNANVGIGTSSPTAKLDINGPLNVNGIISFGSTSPSNSSNISKTGGMNGDIVNINVNGRGGLKNYAIFGYDAGIVLYYPTSVKNTLSVTGSTSLSSLSASGNAIINGNVGIGISPSAKLHVNGSAYVRDKISFYYSGSYYNGITNDGSGNLVFNVGPTAPIMQLKSNAVNIGCSSSGNLNVNGKIQAKEIEIKSTPCSDFVFEGDYKLMNLSDLEQFVKTNKHLPEIPSAKQFQDNGGYNLTQMDDLLLRKVEELTLYIIELKKENEALKQDIKSLK